MTEPRSTGWRWPWAGIITHTSDPQCKQVSTAEGVSLVLPGVVTVIAKRSCNFVIDPDSEVAVGGNSDPPVGSDVDVESGSANTEAA